MSTFILATVGNSMIYNIRRHLSLPDTALPDPREAVAFLRKLDPTDKTCGAEINSISHLLAGQKLSAGEVTPPASIQFLVSDTPEGEWSGRTLRQYFSRAPDVESVEWEKVPGLNGDDPASFAHRGLRSLVKLAAKHLKQAQERDPNALRVIDATGGYKAQISFAGLIGQALKVPVVYLFERFPRCIEMPPMPVEFDRGLWIEHYELFSRLSEESCVPADEVRREDVSPSLWDLLDRETIDGVECLALSPILELMHQTFYLYPPPRLRQPRECDIEAKAKLHINEAHMAHAPHNSRQRMEQLARLPWVTHVEPIEYVNTSVRGRVMSRDTEKVDEIYVIHGDGSKGLKIRLRTTATNGPERDWCLEQLRELMER